jgi:DNA (cytosine-5)-methyltransferase 1
MNKNNIRVVELFAGVGGFRIGLDRATKKEMKKTGIGFETVWSNQWEPSTKKQHAYEVLKKRFGENGISNEDIAKVDLKEIPEHDLLVGGFPCQDYSVARTLSQAEGLHGKKGVLWWEIYRIINGKKNPPKYLFLENVDRLLRSPASSRGRDFAIMLSSLAKENYTVEWRVINAAEYGKPQRRRRTFILAYKKGTRLDKELRSHVKNPKEWLTKTGLFAQAFKVGKDVTEYQEYSVGDDPVKLSEQFKQMFGQEIHFRNAGMMVDGKVYTAKTNPDFKGKKITLGECLVDEKLVPEEYFVKKDDIANWKYLKGAKNEPRKTKDGFTYQYTEGAMIFPDKLDEPSRTIITAEGGSTPSRFKHVIQTPSGKWRRLMPIELERLCQFPDNHTNIEGVPDTRRAFFMGNALVVGVIEDVGKTLLKRIADTK